MEPWSPQWKQQCLDGVYADWENCQRCLLASTRNNVVFGVGNPDANIMFIGEGPGEQEDEAGEPFVGDSGQLLRSMWESLQEEWADVYITNIVACRPPENRDPTATEKNLCLPRLQSIIYIVDPLLIVAIGKYALNTLVGGRSWGVEKYHGKLFSSPNPQVRVTGEPNGVEVPGVVFPRKGANKRTYTLEYDLVPIFHPAYILRRDSYDRKSGTFTDGGEAHQTMDDLQAVIDRVTQLQTEYEVILQP